jgi:hypothetical protein
MNEQYRGFNLYRGSEPISETLLGRVTQWKPTGCIAHKHRNGVITELTRFQFPMTFDDDAVAKCFGLETARLLLDASFRDFQIARYESEKRLIKQRRGGPSTVNFK